MLKLINIKKEYIVANEHIVALDGLSINFRRSEFVAILGPSGCGKTTTLNILGGLDRYDSGDLIIDGTSTKDYGDRNWDNYRNKRIGFVFQNYNLIPHLTILGNVELALTISGVAPKKRKQMAKDALIRVGLGKHLNNKPTQLSGGQAQRVAIARAIVNNPEIILLDEPTGALDSKTSVDILDLIKEIGRNHLVIMVTHNPDLAHKYADRIVTMSDGLVTTDSNPFDGVEKFVDTSEKDAQKTKMSYATAVKVSARNLLTKKRRTLLTAFACAIGILGIALILSLTNGLNQYINDITRNSVESSPITISAGNITQGELNFGNNLTPFPEAQEVFVNHTLRPRVRRRVPYTINDFFANNFDSEWYHDIIMATGMQVRMFSQRHNGLWQQMQSDTGVLAQVMGTNIISQMAEPNFTYQLYEIINEGGRLPENKNEIALVVDQRNAITDTALIQLGWLEVDPTDPELNIEIDSFSFQEVMDMRFKIPTNLDRFQQNASGFFPEITNVNNMDLENMHTVKITAVLRLREEVDMGIYGTGLVFPVELIDYLEEINYNSPVVRWMHENPLRNPANGQLYAATSVAAGGQITTRFDRWENRLRELGGVMRAGTNLNVDLIDWVAEDLAVIPRLGPNAISIYPSSLEGKNQMIATLDLHNSQVARVDRIVYVDLLNIIAGVMTTMIDVIGYVLIGFTSISLVVSSVMISIVTSISVLERTKEIGVLRSLGARKKDVSRLFNAENIIVGFLSGLFGLLLASFFVILINLILAQVAGIPPIAEITWVHVIVLIGISTTISFIAGFIPARAAAKKDPVLALRTE